MIASRTLRRAPVVLGVTLLLVVAGCSGPFTSDTGEPTRTPESTTVTTTQPAAESTTTETPDEETDTQEDRIGWVDGYWYNDTIAVTHEDGYNESEREAILGRAMARVEMIRGLNFRRTVDLVVLSPQESRLRFGNREPDPIDDQVWEALFIVNESTHVATVFNGLTGDVSRYSPRKETIYITLEEREPFEVSTLAHELVHALQHQHGLLPDTGASLDSRNAALALVDGDADYVRFRYIDRCQTDWDCIGSPNRPAPPDSSHPGYILNLVFRYEAGPTFVAHLKAEEGWDTVNDAYDDPPTTSKEVIHPEEHPDTTGQTVTVDDRSNASWQRVHLSDADDSFHTVGEFGVYALFWANGLIDQRHLTTDTDREFNYSHPITDGWAGDTLVPYRNDQRWGYVFKTTWETEEDARQFEQAYLEILESLGAEQVRPGVYRIPEDREFADAFRVTRQGDTVIIVNAPTVDALPGVHAPPDEDAE